MKNELLESLTTYYIVGHNEEGGTIFANKYTHQLYDVRYLKHDAAYGFDDYEPELVFVPLMVQYEQIFDTPIEECNIWNGCYDDIF